MGATNPLFKGRVAGLHVNSAIEENEVDAEIFNDIENAIKDLDDYVGNMSTTQVEKLIDFVKSLDRNIQYEPEVYSGARPTPINVLIRVGITDGTLEPFSDVDEVRVKIISDTTGGALINGLVSPQVIAIADGEAVVAITPGPNAGTVTLGLEDSGNTDLDVTSEATVTFS